MHEKATLTLHENVVSTDHITILEDKYYYVGHNKATVKLTYYTYANEWSDREHVKYFKSVDNAIEWYEKNFRDRAIDQGRIWSEEDGTENASEEEAINIFELCTVYCEC